MQDYRKLIVWQKAHSLAVRCHQLSRSISRAGNAGLVSQTRRAAESIPANIAEGSGRHSAADFANFVDIAIGSSSELEYHLQYLGECELIPADVCSARKAEVVEVRKMLIGLKKRLRPPCK